MMQRAGSTQAILATALVLLAVTALPAGAQAPAWWTGGAAFRLQVVPDGRGGSAEAAPGRPAHLWVFDGERYVIRLTNPLPVSVAVGLTVDGLNTITGLAAAAAEGAKWILDPHSTATIDGWQVGTGTARRFVFTQREESYAAWRSRREPALAVRYGEIAAAFFWSAQDLERSLPRETGRRKVWPAGARFERPAILPWMRDAGTAMGERTPHPVQWVPFHYDTGMYDPAAALVVRYALRGVAPWRPTPERPWTDLERPGFAPEMP